MKGATNDEIIAAIERAHTGPPPEMDSLMDKVRNSMVRRRPTYDEDIPLTNREVQVVRHFALGLSNREIGRSLDISIETVKESMCRTPSANLKPVTAPKPLSGSSRRDWCSPFSVFLAESRAPMPE
jgi:FixJ family two-component response regulator